MKSFESIAAINPAAEIRHGCLYIPNTDPHPASTLTLLDVLPWWSRRPARHEYFMCDRPISYAYDSQTTYTAEPFVHPVDSIMNYLNRFFGMELNGCFLNKYDNEHCHLGWHADDGEGMRHDQPIAVMSYGAEREIWVKPMGESGKIPDDQKFLLQHGSLFVMPPGMQETHFHRIPKHDRPCGPRTSLTFRSFKP